MMEMKEESSSETEPVTYQLEKYTCAFDVLI